MNLLVTLVVLVVGTSTQGFGIADMISNYARVAVNAGNFSNTTPAVTTEMTTTNSSIIHENASTNETDTEDDDELEYDDFDDVSETPVEHRQQSAFDSSTMMTYLNGVVNLLALMYKFSGRPVDKQSLHFGGIKPKKQEEARQNLAEAVNSIAEPRYQPSTAHKKFKLKQNAYQPIDTYSSYMPYTKPKSESYDSAGGSSYDSDSDQYMINNPEKVSDTMDKPTYDSGTYKESPMKDYMSQNDDVDIQQSYSYEVPQDKKKLKNANKTPPMEKPSMSSYWESGPPPPDDDNDDHPPGYYPWKTKPMMMTPDDSMKIAGDPPAPPPDDDHDDHRPVYYPWKTKPMMTPDDSMKIEEDPPAPPPDDDMNNIVGPVYYPWMTKPKKTKPSRPPPPPPIMDDDDDHHHDHHIEHPSPWMTDSHDTKPPGEGKNKYPPPDDHHSEYYPYFPEHDSDHGFIDDHDDHHDHHDHDMVKDEDRESKRPYTYYHLGRKLWYVPLLFSLYFIVYIGALILKSIARHKVQFPEKLWELHDSNHDHDHDHGHSRLGRKIDEVTRTVHDSIDSAKNKFM